MGPKENKANIKVVCFDLDGVYFTKDGTQSFKKSILNLGVSKEDMEFVLFDSPQMKSFKKGEMVEQDFWDFARETWKVKNTNTEFERMLASGYAVDTDVVGLVTNLRAEGYKTAVCSNNYKTRVRVLDKKFDFLTKFDIAVFSYEVGVLKPDKRIFEELAKKSAVKPEQIIYSDDSEAKLKGAQQLGIETFVYTTFPQFKQKLSELGVVVLY